MGDNGRQRGSNKHPKICAIIATVDEPDGSSSSTTRSGSWPVVDGLRVGPGPRSGESFCQGLGLRLTWWLSPDSKSRESRPYGLEEEL